MKKFMLFAVLSFLVTGVAWAQTDTGKGVIGKDEEGNLVRATVWLKYVAKSTPVFENAMVTMENTEEKVLNGCRATINLNQTEAKPIVFSAESKVENASGTPSADYSVYLDIVYNDDTFKYGVVTTFKTGTHDWEKSERTFTPEKPIKSIRAYVLFRNKTGKATFRNVELREK